MDCFLDEVCNKQPFLPLEAYMINRKIFLTVLLVLAAVLPLQAQGTEYERWFNGGTMRLDCLREGSAEGDSVYVKRVSDRQARWHGSRTQLIDPFDNGDYRVEMRDAVTGQVLYSRGYSNLFREYKDTPEGRTVKAQFEETLLLPMPRKTVTVALQKRDAEMKIVDQSVITIDPARMRMSEMSGRFQTGEGERGMEEVHGDPSVKFDVAFVMQGFDKVDDETYRQTCRRMLGVLFGKQPFRSHRKDFNVYFVKGDAGVEYNTFGVDRYAMTTHVWRLHQTLGGTPCDHIIVVINDTVYGGGAIYNFYSVSSLHSMAEFVLPHELGHGIGGLADEYVDEDLSYADLHRTKYEPLEPNITNLVDFGSKWKRLLPADTPVPTPARQVLRSECGPLGVYEGAGYSSKGVYRPAMHCMMRDYAPFCPVCHERLEAVFGLYTK